VAAVFGEEFERGRAGSGVQSGGEFAVLFRYPREIAGGADTDPGQQEQVDLRADRLPRLRQAPVPRGRVSDE